MLRMTRRGAALLLVAACGGGVADRLRDAPITEVRHRGFRTDLPDSDRGNAVFDDAVFSADGAFLVTQHHLGGLRVWDGHTGTRLSQLNPARDGNEPWIVDGATARYVSRRQGQAGLALFDLRTGAVAAVIPEPADSPAVMLGLGPAGSVVIARPGVIEIWSLDSATRRASLVSPYTRERYRPSCTGGVFATYNDKKCWELSPKGRWLAMAVTPDQPPNARSRFALLDLQALTTVDVTPPDSVGDSHLAAFAFSDDERLLAIGTDRGVWIRDLAEGKWVSHASGQHRRNALLGAMGFADGGARLVVLGDQMQVSTIEVATGHVLGRIEPPTDDWEGIFRMSRDGSRVVLYHFTSDILEVIDGRTSKRTGWICPFFCNSRHNPVPVSFVLSPDGRTVAAAHRYGAGLWNPTSDRLIMPLNDSTLPPRRPR